MSEQDDTTVETDDVDTDLVDDSDDGDTGDADKLGDAGKKALDSMKSKWQKERDARKALEAKMAADSKPDDQQDPAEMRKQAQAEAEDARALLAARVEDFVDDGQVDVDAINEALADLLSKKPHLAAATAKRFQGGADGGARKGSQVAQLTEQDIKRMTPQQIEKARLSGQLNHLLGVS
jgi:hypothetical protein